MSAGAGDRGGRGAGAPGPADRRPVVVVGAGLAGLTAALDLLDAGHDVLVLEARARAGGCTATFTRAAAGHRPLAVDTGQHVGLRCYDAWLGLLDRLGTRHLVDVQPRLRIPVVRLPAASDSPPRRAVLSRDGLPAPAHLLRALAGYRLLAPASRVRAVRAAAALRRVDPGDPAADRTSFGSWLRDHGGDAASLEAVWDLLTVAACNAGVDEVSLATAATVLQRALLSRADAGDLVLPAAPLAAVHVDPAVAALRAGGAEVRLHEPVRAVEMTADGPVVRTTGGPVRAAGVVCAVPAHAARALLPDGVAIPDGLRYAPIVNVHLVLDRVVTDEPFLAAIGGETQWLFDRTRPAGLADLAGPAIPAGVGHRGRRSGHQYLAASLSAAGEQVDTPAADLSARLVAELRRLLPAADDARVLDAFVTRERRATFVAGPGTAALRPPARTGLRGLVLAGAWTATGLPDTMEGAVVSGHAAARALLADAGAGTPVGLRPGMTTAAGAPGARADSPARDRLPAR